MKVTDHAATLGDLVLHQPAAAALFERLGLDYCCGGRRTLEQACSQRGLDAQTVSVLLDALRDEPATPSLHHHDVARSSITELRDHIVAGHHEPLGTDLAHISDLLATVVRVHAKARPELLDLQRLFATTCTELEIHLRLEEHVLFPACRNLDERDDASAFDEGLLVLLEDNHETTGDALYALRELSGGYDTDRALCGTHRALLQSLGVEHQLVSKHLSELLRVGVVLRQQEGNFALYSLPDALTIKAVALLCRSVIDDRAHWARAASGDEPPTNRPPF